MCSNQLVCMKTIQPQLPVILTTAITTLLFAATSGQAASVKFEAESGTRGADYAIGSDGGIQYIYPTSNAAGESPGSSARVVTYSVTFPTAGTYDLYARVRVGPAGADDDSFFYGGGFGTKSPTSSGDWIRVNSLNVGGYTAASDVVAGSGSAGITVWKWVNLSEFSNGSSEAGITFTVTAGNLTQTFQIGAREDGFYIDALVFGTANYTFTVAQLDAGTGGDPPPPAQPGLCTVHWNDVHQRIDGFGASSAWRSSWTTAQADMFFSTNSGIGLSLLRNHITAAGSTSSTDTPTTSEWSIMQMAQARGARVWSAPWTPANGFKDSGVANGGNYLGSGANATNLAYASQLANYVSSMTNTYGVNLYAISVQNEADYNTTSWESCVWTGSQIRDFVTNLHNALVAKGVGSTKIIIPESANWSSNPGLFTPSLTDTNVAPDVGIVANHNYVANNSVGDTATPGAVATYGKPLWETEVATTSSYDGSINNAMYWAWRIHLFLTVPEVSAWHYWWLLPLGSDNQGLTDSSGNPAKRMYVLGNYSRFVRPGYYRIGVSNNTNSLVTAFKDTNSATFAIVAINTNAGTDIIQTFDLTNFTASSVTPWVTSASFSLASQPAVTVTNSSFTYTLPALSVVTFVGQANQSNSPPTDITLSNNLVPENQPANTVVGSFNTTDPDSGDTFTYSLVSGTGSTDNASFNISGNSLRTSAAFDYESKSSYSIRVRSTDQGSLWTEKAFTITVTNVNEMPTDIALSDSTVPENQPGDTVVGTLSTADPDSGNTFTYSLVSGAGGADNASFSISSNSLHTSAVFDYETRSSYSIRVRSTDQGGLSFEKAFAVTVADINEAPMDIALSNAAVPEGQPVGTLVGTFDTTDPDSGNTFNYSLVSGEGSTGNASFNIASNALVTAVIFDYGMQTNYSIRVRSTDQGTQWVEKIFSVVITPFNRPQTIVSIAARPDGNFTLTFSGIPAQAYQVQAATNLTPPIAWEPLTNNVDGTVLFIAGTNGLWTHADLHATNFAVRYYRTAAP